MQVNHLLITSFNHLGDFIAKVPFIRIFKKYYPQAQLTVMGPSYIQPLCELFEEINHFIDFEPFFLREDGAIIDALKKLKIDALFHVLGSAQNRGPDVHAYAQKAHIPHRIGNIDRSKWSLFKHKNFSLTHNLCAKRILKNTHEFEWQLHFLKFFGITIDFNSLDFSSLLKCLTPFEKSPHIHSGFNLIIHPATLGNAKEWPLHHFIELINCTPQEIRILITGTESEKNQYPLKGLLREVKDLRGQLDLKSFCQLIQQADAIVANSTGPIHIASLFQTKILALFPKQSSMSASVWGPKSPHAKVISSSKICLPCQKKITELNPKRCQCMSDIEVQPVFESLQSWWMNESFV